MNGKDVVNSQICESKFRSLLIVLVVLIIVSGCTRQKTNIDNKLEEEKAVKSVRAYNEGLVAALQSLDVGKIKNYTTEKQLSQDQLYIVYLKEKLKVIEKDEILTLRVEKVKVTDEVADVQTVEVWRVKQQNIDTKKMKDFGEIFYKNTYKLLKENDKWYLDSIEGTELVKNKSQNKNSITTKQRDTEKEQNK